MTGAVPSDWTKALVTAIHKKDSKSNPANYRPLSLTSLCCKVMEHIILSHIAKLLAANNILINQQHGFRQRFSCETQLISAVNDWAKCINSRSQTDVILLDFSKAFDSVPHQCLLLKLDYYGICGKTAAWIKAFLSSQVVSVNGSHSSSRPVPSGVPQGSVLGPVLFLLYINDITEHIQSTMRLFADDSIIYREIKNICDHALLQQDLISLCEWAETWHRAGWVMGTKKFQISLSPGKQDNSNALPPGPKRSIKSLPYASPPPPPPRWLDIDRWNWNVSC